MGRKATGSVFARGDEIRVQFQWQGKRVSETLQGYSALNPAHMRQAERILADIVQKVGNGVFDYASTFPDSKRAMGTASATTFGEVMKSFLARVETTKSQRTIDQYADAAEAWLKLIGKDTVMRTLTPKRLSDIVYVECTWTGASRLNNALIPLRGALRLAMESDKGLPDYLDVLENMDKEEGDPDPVEQHEMRSILAHIKKNFPPQAWAWYAFAFSTGLRPSEQCVLTHKDIYKGKIRVSKAQDSDGSVKSTKTKGTREVDLSPLSREAVEISLAYPNPTGEIFQNPWSGQRWKGNRSQHENIWLPTLKSLGIRERRSYCTRHTFASTLLQNGAKVAHVVARMGHVSHAMIEEKYHRWIDQEGSQEVFEKSFT